MKRPSKFRIFLLVVLAVLLAMAFLQDRAGPEISPGSTLVLEIGGEYVEAAQPSLIARALGEDQRSFVSLLSTLTMAERDDRLAAVVLVIRPLQIGWGKADELRAAVGRLGDAGRKTVAFLEVASFSATREYYVATAADEIYVVEGGAVPVVGLAAEYLFLGGLWEKLGVGFEVGKAGKYKSAVESYTGRGMSEPTREMAESLLDSANGAFVDAIAEGRGMDRTSVVAARDSRPGPAGGGAPRSPAPRCCRSSSSCRGSPTARCTSTSCSRRCRGRSSATTPTRACCPPRWASGRSRALRSSTAAVPSCRGVARGRGEAGP